MRNRNAPAAADPQRRTEQAEILLAQVFRQAGWQVQSPKGPPDAARPDLLVRQDDASYAVEVNVASEGRSDRLIPLWSQALLQALRAAGDQSRPLAVVAAPRISPHVAEQILAFAAEYAPEAAVGVMDFAGLRRFRGPGLEHLDAGSSDLPLIPRSMRREAADLFSDLNQWMLKVLLAPELPASLLSAPRGRYPHASALAQAAHVSVMSASRFVRQLEHDGYLDRSLPYLHLVRRDDLFRRWAASAAARRVKEVPMRVLLRKDPMSELRRVLHRSEACLGLFAAADALGLGFVHGVPSHVYVKRLDPPSLASWKNLVPAEPHEAPDIIVRQAPAPESIFRGVVQAQDMPVSDVVQVWLDVASHPARGQEQAEQIRRRVLAPVIEGDPVHG